MAENGGEWRRMAENGGERRRRMAENGGKLRKPQRTAENGGTKKLWIKHRGAAMVLLLSDPEDARLIFFNRTLDFERTRNFY